MGVRDIVIKVIGDTGGVHGSLTGLDKRLEGLTKNLEKFGPVGKQAAASLEGLASASGLAGASLIGGAAAGATLAGVALVGLGLKASNMYLDLTRRVSEFERVSGASADQSSRLVETFAQFGVSSETASGAMFKLSRRAVEQAETFQRLGIEVAKNSDGSVNLTETLFNVAKAYNSTQNAAERNRIVFAAFGRAGAEMIPVLAQGDERLRALAASAHMTLTQQDIDRVREYTRKQRELDLQLAATGEKFGQATLPLRQWAGELLQDLVVLGTSTESLKHFHANQQKATSATENAARALQEHQTAAENDSRAVQDAADKALGLADAELHQREAALNVERAERTYNEAVKEHGAASIEAREASAALDRAVLSQAQALIRSAEKSAEASAAAQGLTDATGAAQWKVEQERASLQQVANTLEPGSPLRNYLEQYIERLGAIQRDIQTRLVIVTEEQLAATGRQHGGDVEPGRLYKVGEAGTELVEFPQRGYVHSAGDTRRLLSGNGNGHAAMPGSTYNINVSVSPTANQADIGRTIVGAIQEYERRGGKAWRL